MRTWDRIKKNSIIILFLINSTFMCYLITDISIIPNSKTKFQSFSYSNDSTSDPSSSYNEISINIPTRNKILSPQRIIDVNDSFGEFYDQINPVLLKNQFSGINTTIAILDSGINNNSWVSITETRYSTMPNPSKVADDNGHGTLVAGIISKIAPNSSLISIKVADENGSAKVEWVEDGLKLALSLNVSIIHASLGSTQLKDIDSSLIANISERNIPLIVSAGNYGPYGASLATPAIFPETIAVGMAYNQTHLDYDQTIQLLSSKGPRPSGIMGPDILAPGINITGYDHQNNIVTKSGTSYAAPFLSGGIALLKECFPNITTTTLKAAILDSANFMNDISPILQGNGFFDLSKTYTRLLNTNKTHPLFVFAPREISSHFTYFGHAINGVNRTYRISLYSTANSTLSEVNITQTFPMFNNQTENNTDIPDFPIQIKIDKLNENITSGLNFLNISVFIPQNLSMALRKGNVSFYFTNGTSEKLGNSNLTITIENIYPGGKVLFYQGYDNDTFVPDGPTGGFSQLQFFLEAYYGMQSEGAIRPGDLISPIDPLFTTDKISGGISETDLKNHHILVLSDIEFGITDQEITVIQDWVSAGHSLLVLSFPSQIINNTETLSNQTAINKLLNVYGIKIENDSTNLTRFNKGIITVSDPIFDEKGWEFDYIGSSLDLTPEKGNKVLATATDRISDESNTIAAYWENETSKGKVVVFGGLLPFIDTGVISNPLEIDNLLTISRIFHWMIQDQQIPLDIQLVSGPATKGTNIKIQILIDDSDFHSSYINATIREANGSYTQLSFLKKNNIYIASWKPMATGNAKLWLNIQVSGNVPTNAAFSIQVYNPTSSDLFIFVLLGGFVLFGVIFYFLSSRRTQPRSPIEEKLAMEFKKQQQQRDAKHYGLDTLEICPQCQKPRFKSESKYCFNCGREL